MEKGIITTVVGYELTDPKAKINLVNEIICSARCFSSSYEQESANTLHTKIYLQCRKGIRLIFLSLDPVLRGNANELGDVSRCPGKSSLFFLTILNDRGIILYGDTVRRLVKHSTFLSVRRVAIDP